MGEPGMLATLFGVIGSSYRLPGAMMLVTQASGRIGGVSGGCLEEYVAREGSRLARANGGPALLSFDTAQDADDEAPRVPTPGCGGRLDVLVEPLSAEHADLLDAIVAARATGLPAVLAHVWREQAPPAAASVRRALFQGGSARWDASNLRAEPVIASRCGDVESTQTAFQGRVRLDGVPQRVLLQPIEPLVRLLVFGAGDDACALVQQANLLGWEVTVCDRRARLATTTRFPTAFAVRAEDWDRLLPSFEFQPNTAAIVMTHSLQDDAAVLAKLCRCSLAYVGLLGPPARRDAVLAAAAACAGRTLPAGFAKAIHGPTGLDLGLKTPEGIALAIAAEIVAALHGRAGRALSETEREFPVDDDALQAAP
jgi:xanthine/CO dehydrogenase XdhC/CoxF family maturation factor